MIGARQDPSMRLSCDGSHRTIGTMRWTRTVSCMTAAGQEPIMRLPCDGAHHLQKIRIIQETPSHDRRMVGA